MRQFLSLIFLFYPIWILAQTFGSLTTENGLMDNSVTAFFQDSDGLMYLGTFRGVDRFDGTHIVNIPFAEGNRQEMNRITAIVRQDNQHLLVGNGDGLWQLDKQTLTLRRVFAEIIDCGVTAMRVSHQHAGKDKITIDTQFGVYELSQDKLHKVSYRRSSVPVNRNVLVQQWGRFPTAHCTYRSPYGGNQWAGYMFFGADYTFLNRGIFKMFSVPGVIDSRTIAVRNFYHDGPRLFFCTRQGLYLYDRTVNSYRPIAPALLGSSIITQILRMGDEYLVATVGQGVKVLDRSSLTPKRQWLDGANVYQLCDDGKGRVWICSSVGLACYNSKTRKLSVFNTHDSQLPSNEVFCIGFDASGTGWISTAGGLCQYLPGIDAINSNGLPKKLKKLGPLRVIDRLRGGQLLLLPQHGLPQTYHVADDRLRPVRLQLQDTTSTVLYLHIINDNSYIFATSNGIYAQQGQRLRKFGYIDGLNNMEFQSHAFQLDDKGVLWLASNGGLAYARLHDMFHHRYRHENIILSSIQTDHWFSAAEVTAVMMDGELCLSRYRSEFTAQFTPVIFGRTGNLSFRYRLIGANDSIWKKAPYDRTILYNHLSPGRYRLVIEAEGMPEISTSIAIVVPYTYSAITLGIVIILLLLILAYIGYCKYYKKPYFWKEWGPKPVHYQYSSVSPTRAHQLQKQLLALMEEKKPYLKPDLQMSDLAKALGCSSHELSQVFSQYFERNYYDFIAEYRVNEFKQLAALPQYAKYTITSLSELCGFRSRTPFLTAFKKFTGKTPKEYMKSIGK